MKMNEIKMKQEEFNEKCADIKTKLLEIGVMIDIYHTKDGFAQVCIYGGSGKPTYSSVQIVPKRVPLPTDTPCKMGSIVLYAAGELTHKNENIFYYGHMTSREYLTKTSYKDHEYEVLDFPNKEMEINQRALKMLLDFKPVVDDPLGSNVILHVEKARKQITNEYKEKYGHLKVRGWE